MRRRIQRFNPHRQVVARGLPDGDDGQEVVLRGGEATGPLLPAGGVMLQEGAIRSYQIQHHIGAGRCDHHLCRLFGQRSQHVAVDGPLGNRVAQRGRGRAGSKLNADRFSLLRSDADGQLVTRVRSHGDGF